MTSSISRTIRGIVIPVTWGEEGEVIRIAVDTYQEERYWVAENALGRELRELLRRRVRVQGDVNVFPNRPPVIEVKSYESDESPLNPDPSRA